MQNMIGFHNNDFRLSESSMESEESGSKIDDNTAKVEILQKEITQWRKKYDEVSKVVNDLRKDNECLKVKNNFHKSQISELKNSVEKKEQCMNDLRDTFTRDVLKYKNELLQEQTNSRNVEIEYISFKKDVFLQRIRVSKFDSELKIKGVETVISQLTLCSMHPLVMTRVKEYHGILEKHISDLNKAYVTLEEKFDKQISDLEKGCSLSDLSSIDFPVLSDFPELENVLQEEINRLMFAQTNPILGKRHMPIDGNNKDAQIVKREDEKHEKYSSVVHIEHSTSSSPDNASETCLNNALHKTMKIVNKLKLLHPDKSDEQLLCFIDEYRKQRKLSGRTIGNIINGVSKLILNRTKSIPSNEKVNPSEISSSLEKKEPDAICSYESCASKPMFFNAENFRGYITVLCNEKCVLKYHMVPCWSNIKDSLACSYKEITSHLCLTPDCFGSIFQVEVYDKDGSLKKMFVSEEHSKDNKSEKKKSKLEKKSERKQQKKEKRSQSNSALEIEKAVQDTEDTKVSSSTEVPTEKSPKNRSISLCENQTVQHTNKNNEGMPAEKCQKNPSISSFENQKVQLTSYHWMPAEKCQKTPSISLCENQAVQHTNKNEEMPAEKCQKNPSISSCENQKGQHTKNEDMPPEIDHVKKSTARKRKKIKERNCSESSSNMHSTDGATASGNSTEQDSLWVKVLSKKTRAHRNRSQTMSSFLQPEVDTSTYSWGDYRIPVSTEDWSKEPVECTLASSLWATEPKDRPYLPKQSKKRSTLADYMRNDSENDCAICLDPMHPSTIYWVDCGHSFHERCIRKWVARNRNCPTCRRSVLFSEDYPELR